MLIQIQLLTNFVRDTAGGAGAAPSQRLRNTGCQTVFAQCLLSVVDPYLDPDPNWFQIQERFTSKTNF